MSITKLTLDLLQGYLTRNEVPPQDLPALIRNIHQLVGNLSAGETDGSVPPVVTQVPADDTARIAARVQETEPAKPPVPSQPMPSVAPEAAAPVEVSPAAPAGVSVEEPTVAAVVSSHADILDQFLKWRQRENLSSHTIAGQIGITPAYLSQVERGKRVPSSVLVQRLLELMKNTASASVPLEETKQTKTEPKEMATKTKATTTTEETKPVKAQSPIEEPVVSATPEPAVIVDPVAEPVAVSTEEPAAIAIANLHTGLLEQFLQWIQQKNISQRVAAERLQVTSSYLSKIVHGKETPSPQLVQRIQDLMGMKRAKTGPKRSVPKPKVATNAEKAKPVKAQSPQSRVATIPEPSVTEALEQEKPLPVTPAAIAEEPTAAVLVNPPADVPNQLLLWRLQKNLSQNAVAGQLGISRSRLSEIERGKTVPSFEVVRRIQELMEGTASAPVTQAHMEQDKTALK